jgi:hypothetical protein
MDFWNLYFGYYAANRTWKVHHTIDATNILGYAIFWLLISHIPNVEFQYEFKKYKCHLNN